MRKMQPSRQPLLWQSWVPASIRLDWPDMLFLPSIQIWTKVKSETEDQKWLMENSWKYGFILRYPLDKSDITGARFFEKPSALPLCRKRQQREIPDRMT